MTEKEKMLAGNLYNALDQDLRAEFTRARMLIHKLNQTEDMASRLPLFQALFQTLGDNAYIEIPFRCDYGSQIAIGHHFYANYQCTMLDVCQITIGDYVLLGPNVSLFTASHPIDATIRKTGLECGKPITIGSDVWIGGNTVINPGISIGSNVVIGSGSVVTKDIPSNVVAVGNPCRVLREITEKDKAYWQHAYQAYQKI